MTTEQDMQDVIERLTESDDDFVLASTYSKEYYPNHPSMRPVTKLFTRGEASSTPSYVFQLERVVRVLKPFQAKDGIWFHPDK